MKVAARFPIKANIPLSYLLIVGHFSLLMVSIFYLNSVTYILVIVAVTAFSYFTSYQQYLKVTEFEDDLCWSGENWLVHCKNVDEDVSFLELLETSWITAEFSLLKFNMADEEIAWLFTRKSLGERLYSELCYLAKLDLRH